jgi:hypothetical protein
VHPYIRKYLLYHYSEPFFVTERGYVPAFILNALERPVKVAPSELKKKDKISYGEFIGIQVGNSTVRKHGNCISGENVKLFNEVVSDLIHEEMYRFVTQLKNNRCQVDDSIRSFQAMYNFTEDELPFENLKRWYYRERARIEMRREVKEVMQPQFTLNFFEEKEKAQAQANDQLGAQMSLLGFGG